MLRGLFCLALIEPFGFLLISVRRECFSILSLLTSPHRYIGHAFLVDSICLDLEMFMQPDNCYL